MSKWKVVKRGTADANGDGGLCKEASGYVGLALWGEDSEGKQGIWKVRDQDNPKDEMKIYE